MNITPVAGASWGYHMVGRLKPGLTAAQAQSDAQRVAEDIMRNYPPMMASLRITSVVRPLQDQQKLSGTNAPSAAHAAAGRGRGAADCLRQPCRAHAGARHSPPAGNRRPSRIGRARRGPASPGAAGKLSSSVGPADCLGWLLAALALAGALCLLPESPSARRRDRARLAGVGLSRLLLAVVTGMLCGLAPAFAALRTT